MQAAVLDFFGVPVKAQDVLGRIKELTLLGKRIKRFKDPVAQFRLKSHPRVPSWSKACGWTQGNTTLCMLILMLKFHLFDDLIVSHSVTFASILIDRKLLHPPDQ